MAVEVLGLLFADKPRTKIEGGEIDITVDAALTVAHKYGLTVTSSPIEDGSSVDDHAVRDPDELTMEGFVSDHPVEFLGGVLRGEVAGGAVGELLGATPRSVSAYALLRKAVDDKALLTVLTRFRTYDDMLATNLEVQQAQEVGEALRFQLTLRHVRRVGTSATSVLDKLTDAAKDDAAPTASRGRKPAKAPAAAPRARAENYLVPP